MTPKLLVAEGARIDAAGSMLLEGLTATIDGGHVGLLGMGWEALFRLLSSEATLTRGTLRVLGVDAGSAACTNHVGLAPGDPPLPAEFAAAEYLAASARLIGLGPFAARRSARTTLERLGIPSLGKKKIATLNLTERRALVIAHATLESPPVLALEAPLSGLDGPAAESITTLIGRAAEGRHLLLRAESQGSVGSEARLLAGLDQVAILSGGHVVIGAPASVLRPSPRSVVRTSRRAAALTAALERRGCRVEPSVEPPDEEGGGRLVVELPEGVRTQPIVEAALEVGAPILELIPFSLGAAGATDA